jgi:hypothetical protein
VFCKCSHIISHGSMPNDAVSDSRDNPKT